MLTKVQATIEDLYRVPDGGKAEIVDGELILMSPAGGRHGRVVGKIYTSFSNHEVSNGGGFAFGENVGFVVNLPRRKSFSPDAAWFDGGPEDIDMDFIDGAPIFAVEVRSKEDYTARGEERILGGAAMRRGLERKIQDYFAAGTKIVWDVDMVNELVTVYRSTMPESPTVYGKGETAEAEPAVPGWRMPVDVMFA